ncbi:MAG: hypothetical protein AAFZ91_09520 [Pseudomonadota bacterium]
MRKHIFTRLKMLFAAARVSLYTRRNDVAASKFHLERSRTRSSTPESLRIDDWMFDPAPELNRQSTALAGEMSRLADSLESLREVLVMVTDEAAFPIELTTQAPCAMSPTDTDLFEGEYLPVLTVQDTTIGGDEAFLFEEDTAGDAEQERHAA